MLKLMKRTCTMLAMLVILMASFMSICDAAEACAAEMMNPSLHDCATTTEAKTPAKDIKKEACEAACHVSMVSLPQLAKIPSLAASNEGRAHGLINTMASRHVTVLVQPPQHA